MQHRNSLRALLLSASFLGISATAASAQSQTHRQTPNRTTPKPVTLSVPKGWPQSLAIPKIGVRAPVEALDLTKKSEKDAPHRWGDVAWYDRSARPGDVGRASMYGHLDSYCCPAVFWKLKTLHAGDTVQVYYKTGKPLTFRVQWGNPFPDTKLPTSFIFGKTKERGLVLMTCAGVFHKNTGYDRKWIVYARVVLPNGQLG